MKLSTISPDQRAGLPGVSRPGDSPTAAAGREILRLVEEQVALGPRMPGTGPHDQLARLLEQRLRQHSPEVAVQEFTVMFRGGALKCANLVGIFRARAGSPGRDTATLIGTHYDTRIRADREPDPARRECPIPGANDGGSGTAVLLHLLPWLAHARLARDVGIAFFDAEDLGNIDGKDFSLGSAWCAAHPVAGFTPTEVVALDMVGGKDMVLDIDAYCLEHQSSLKLTKDIFGLGFEQGWQPFTRDKPERVKYIVSDHYPFVRGGTASCILIDIDYPQWHTQDDLPEALSTESLGITEAALKLFLSRPPG
jgi:glutaminyl-peptide cyclotransferase